MALELIKKKKIKNKIFKILERTGTILKIYRSGKSPKIIKIISVLKNFEEIIWFTRPDQWSFQALYTITRLYFGSLNDEQLDRFFGLVLVPRIQEGILKKKKICYHLYLTINFSSSRPKLFFSSIIIPLCASKTSSEKEAIIFGFIISKRSFPLDQIISILVFLLKKTSFTSSQITIIRAILAKNYNLPNKILDFFVDFFYENKQKIKFNKHKKCYLIFFKNYSTFLSHSEKKKLTKLMD
ncbi:bystin-like protein (nucleomorph) [Chroomonas mesostigmatica CCMP1168]|uniref:Bystin-like protein n=1 Tax=Chroomonas mesostigmatica CCMP1168 TaxID=1195612 RepID=J7G9T0_9CRYP|nr:bystin-like protein [Chroomonas mesostigmatica CCMP1168]